MLRINLMFECLHEPKNDCWMDGLHTHCRLYSANRKAGHGKKWFHCGVLGGVLGIMFSEY